MRGPVDVPAYEGSRKAAANSAAPENRSAGSLARAVSTAASMAGGMVRRCGASGRIFICGAGKERPRANGRIELASGVAPERKVTNRRIEATAGETKQSIFPFRCIATGITAIGRGIEPPHVLGKRKAGECEDRECTTRNIRFCFHRLPFIVINKKDRSEVII